METKINYAYESFKRNKREIYDYFFRVCEKDNPSDIEKIDLILGLLDFGIKGNLIITALIKYDIDEIIEQLSLCIKHNIDYFYNIKVSQSIKDIKVMNFLNKIANN